MKPRTQCYGILTRLLPMIILGCAPSTAHKSTTHGDINVEAVLVTKAPNIDGFGNDEAWSHAPSTRVMVEEVSGIQKGQSAPVTIKAVRTATHLYFLVSWTDSTRNDTHKTWVWNAKKKVYQQGSDHEDVLALAFEHTGVFDPDMLSGIEAVWDMWHWKAARTNPAGYAMDKTHHYTKSKPAGKAESFDARHGDTIWIARPEDEGGSPQKSQPAPKNHQGDRIPKYVVGKPSGSAADIRAKGNWQHGHWTVEFARRLSTGHLDDTTFDTNRTYQMGIAVFDSEEHEDHSSSGMITLIFTSGV